MARRKDISQAQNNRMKKQDTSCIGINNSVASPTLPIMRLPNRSAVGENNEENAEEIRVVSEVSRSAAAGVNIDNSPRDHTRPLTTGAAQHPQLSMSDATTPGEISVLGVKSILIPVSTIDLLFQRFDLLQSQLDDLSFYERGDLGVRNSSCARIETVSDLAARISALGKVISVQNTSVVDLSSKCGKLLEKKLES